MPKKRCIFFPLTNSTVQNNHRTLIIGHLVRMRFVPQGRHPYKNADVRSSTLMHFSAFSQILFFYMVHNKWYYFVFKSDCKKSGPEKETGSSVWFYVFNYFLIKLHKTDLK